MYNFYKKYEKVILITILILLHTVVYKLIQMLSVGGVLIYTSWDLLIPFIPLFVIPYALLIPVIAVPFILSFKKAELFRKISYAFIMTTFISDLIYLVFQTTTVRATIIGGDLLNQLILYIYNIDSPLNCFPSLHVSMVTLAFLTTYKINRKFSFVVLPISILIILSTLFIKQHNIIDVVGGLLVASLSYWYFLVRKS